MPRDIPVGNGSLLVCFDQDYAIRDLYFPHVGQENHVGGKHCRFGVWADGTFSWIDGTWKKALEYVRDTLVTEVSLYHESLGLLLVCNDSVDFHENIYIRRITVENMTPQEREVRLFFHQDLNIYGNSIGDTAAYDPKARAVVHYKAARYFLFGGATSDGDGIADFAVGQKGMAGKEGTYKDAEDGVLSGNSIAQGSVDSVVGLTIRLKGQSNKEAFYWIVAGLNWEEVADLDALVKRKRPEVLFTRTSDYWHLWARKNTPPLELLPDEIGPMYRRSLLILRTQLDREGGIIAANDSDVVQYNRDTYSYVWPRDGALVAHALDLAGYVILSQRFYRFVADKLHPDGYFFHKYNPDGTVASSWHPWFNKGKAQLPIQEDETALVIWALWNHFVLYRDIEFIKPLYKPLVKTAADFMCRYRDKATGLPGASYDLWEERRGILGFTVGAVFGGLTAASLFCTVFGETARAEKYREAAAEIRDAASARLWREDLNRFCRMVHYDGKGNLIVDEAHDASLWGLYAFGMYAATDERIRATFSALKDRLWIKSSVGGMARYEDDDYYRMSTDVPGNPWFICTLWFADYLAAAAQNEEELDEAVDIMLWAIDHALPSGVLAEQVHPFTGEPLSVSPLTWSHATFVTLTQRILRRLARFRSCAECGSPLRTKEQTEDWLSRLYGETCDTIRGMCEVR